MRQKLYLCLCLKGLAYSDSRGREESFLEMLGGMVTRRAVTAARQEAARDTNRVTR